MIIEDSIRNNLTTEYTPTFLSVRNFSSDHAGSKHSESHFEVVIVSEVFAGLKRLERHRHVLSTLGDAVTSRVHALTIKCYTAEEWGKKSCVSPPPKCRGSAER